MWIFSTNVCLNEIVLRISKHITWCVLVQMPRCTFKKPFPHCPSGGFEMPDTLPQKFSKYFLLLCGYNTFTRKTIWKKRHLSQMYSQQYNLHFYDSLHLFAAAVFRFFCTSVGHPLLDRAAWDIKKKKIIFHSVFAAHTFCCPDYILLFMSCTAVFLQDPVV